MIDILGGFGIAGPFSIIEGDQPFTSMSLGVVNNLFEIILQVVSQLDVEICSARVC